MIETLSQNHKLFRKIMYAVHRFRAERYMVCKIEPFLETGARILDIGAGPCGVCQIVSKRGFDVIPLDIRNLSVVDGIQPFLFDGARIPFRDDSFDVALILTVLHHVQRPEELVQEAKRVSQRIIIVEDLYLNVIHRYITYIADHIGNFILKGHPHSNRTDREWKELFKKCNLALVASGKNYCFPVFQHGMYVLEK